MKIDMKDVGGSSVLSGAINGKVAFTALLSWVKHEPDEPALLFLDFSNVDFASGSFLRESVFEYKKFIRSSYSNLYPVVANVKDEIVDDLLLLASARNDALMSCTLDQEDRPGNPVLIGSLEPKQSMTLKLVETLGITDANSLMESHGESENTKSTTAWNNRLSGLAARGLVREFISGRSKSYRPLLVGENQ